MVGRGEWNDEYIYRVVGGSGCWVMHSLVVAGVTLECLLYFVEVSGLGR